MSSWVFLGFALLFGFSSPVWEVGLLALDFLVTGFAPDEASLDEGSAANGTACASQRREWHMVEDEIGMRAEASCRSKEADIHCMRRTRALERRAQKVSLSENVTWIQ